MTWREEKDGVTVFISIVIGLLLTIFPLPSAIVWFRPQWLLAIVLFWIINESESYGIFFAWIVGLSADLVTGTPFGMQALIFVFVAYFVMKLHLIILHSPRWQQAIIVGAFSGVAMVLQHFVFSMMGRPNLLMHSALSILLTIIIWPLLNFLLADQEKTPYL